MSITPDPADNFLDAVYVQISGGYESGSDLLSLAGSHPEVTVTWNALAGKLEIVSASGPLPTTVFEDVIEDVVFNSSLSSPSGTRTFSITIGQANYLPSTDHYYRFIPSIGITWSQAKIAAETSSYYGLQGYLATIGAQDEAQLSGEQSNGAGWIGGSDQATEGIWMWVTGPENGSIFWNNGTTIGYSNWNSGEPNNANNEDYAHVTAPGVGQSGSWNDLSNTGEASGDYQPKGYIVEYGGMPGDPVLQISTSTTINIPRIISSVVASRCGDGTVTLTSLAEFSPIYWYDSATGGNLLFTGNSFTTPILNATTDYYVSAFPPSCSTATRNLIVASVNALPVVQVTTPAPGCEDIVTIHASSSSGTVTWYDEPTGGTLLFTGNDYTTPPLMGSTTYYAEASSQACPGNGRVPVTVVVYPNPQLTPDEIIGICENDTVLLDAGLSGQTYLWNPGGETTQTKLVTSQGSYTVTVTSPAPDSCSADKTFTVLEKQAPIISSVVVIGSTLTVYTQNSGDFEYSIDGGPFQSSPVFGVNGSPISQITATEINGCGEDSIPFTAIVSIPLFFTPNEDGFNDIWTATSLIYYPGSSLSIFDRFGKLIKVLDRSTLVWDGTYLSHQMPSSDYWFLLDLANGNPIIRGHFTLKR